MLAGHPLSPDLRQEEVRLLTIDTGLDQPYRVHQHLKNGDAWKDSTVTFRLWRTRYTSGHPPEPGCPAQL